MNNTIKLYDKIWNCLDKDMIKEATELLKVRFKRNNIPINLIKNKVILDMGCGSGRYSIALKKLGAKKVIGLDESEAKQFKYKGVRYIRGNVLNVPFKDNYFDFVFCNGVLHHSIDTLKGIKEIYRVLKKGGSAWLYIYGKAKVWEMIDKIRRKLSYKDSITFQNVLQLYLIPKNKQFLLTDIFFIQHRDYFTTPQVEKWFRNIGFKYRFLNRDVDKGFNERIRKDKPLAKYLKNAELRWLINKP